MPSFSHSVHTQEIEAMARYVVAITFTNGHVNRTNSFHLYTDAMAFARNGISYSGGTVQRVEIDAGERCDHRALWDASWNEASKEAGLRNST